MGTAYEPGRLASYVHVADDNGQVHVFGPSAEVPEWAARKITNKRAWATAPTLPAEDTDQGDDGSDGDGKSTAGEVPARPPTSGRGSGIDAWRSYADHIGALHGPNDDRAAVQAAVEKKEAEVATAAEDGGEE